HISLDRVFQSVFQQLFEHVRDCWSNDDSKAREPRIPTIEKVSQAFLVILDQFHSDTLHHDPFVEAKKAYASMRSAVQSCQGLARRIIEVKVIGAK
ncbi:MAG: hypothetical protein QG604_360, partial [Candidatus Dependentiae bacterium]|nr:hypothetical protein [Candidatus Dependentiae bacterium]